MRTRPIMPVTEAKVARNDLGEAVGVTVSANGVWVTWLKEEHVRKLRMLDKGPRCFGKWPDITGALMNILRRRAYKEVFGKPPKIKQLDLFAKP